MEEVKYGFQKKKKSKNTEKYHISHTGGENGEAGKDVCISESNRDKKYTTEVIKIIVAKLDEGIFEFS